MGTSGPARNLEQAMKNATDSSVIQWTGFVDGAALFKSFDKASLISCGLSLHSTYDTNGLIVPDGDAEKFLSPLMIDKCSIQCARGLSRELYRTTADRGAFAETFGISVDSSVFGVLFGNALEYTGPTMFEFERLFLSENLALSARCLWKISRGQPTPRSLNFAAAAGSPFRQEVGPGLPTQDVKTRCFRRQRKTIQQMMMAHPDFSQRRGARAAGRQQKKTQLPS
jgi:hypothetical protein